MKRPNVKIIRLGLRGLQIINKFVDKGVKDVDLIYVNPYLFYEDGFGNELESKAPIILQLGANFEKTKSWKRFIKDLFRTADVIFIITSNIKFGFIMMKMLWKKYIFQFF